MEKLVYVLVLLLCQVKPYSTVAPAVAVLCNVHPNVMVAVDPVQHRYLPYYTRLSQCQGSAGSQSPNFKTCVKKEAKNRSFSVIALPSFQNTVITLQEHTSCQAVCVLSSNSCDYRYQTWDGNDCKCDCKYRSEPTPSICKAPLVWLQSACTCGCPLSSNTCSDKKEWNKDDCTCRCKKRYYNRCQKKNKMLSEEGCRCIEPPVRYLNGTTAAARQADTKCTGIRGGIVIMIVVLEFLFLLAIFLFIYRGILRYEPELEPNASAKKRMQHDFKKIKHTIKRQGKKVPPPTKESSENLQPKVVQQNPPIKEWNGNTYMQEVETDIEKELDSDVPSFRDEPINFYPDQVPYGYDYDYDPGNSEPYHHRQSSGQTTVV